MVIVLARHLQTEAGQRKERLLQHANAHHHDLVLDAGFELDAQSGSGGITIDHPLVIEGRINKRYLRGQVRGGGDLLRIDTGSGSIRVE